MDSSAPRCLPLKGWHVSTIDGHHSPCIVDSHRAVFNEVVVENEFKMLLSWSPNHGIQLLSMISAFDLLPVKTISVASYSNNKRVAGNVVANCFRVDSSVMVVEP